MQCFLSNPNWIQVVLTGVTLIVLCVYVYDTRRIAQASVAQAENSQKAFLVLLPKPAEFERHGGGWALENQGFGPAMNIRHSDIGGGGQFRENVRALAKTDFIILEGFNIDVMRNHVFTAEYESLGGRRYRTVVQWRDGIMRTTFRAL